ncbi:PocR ligand-binding domain-containing protein [Sporomusa malonica]|uniref:histidine kinase n=1 Tax=Sporomusa malonica TaxID=112901 RepID=A0A1W2D4M7_9FIRM|nr:PocR ligand-binding domain-containing protein [Sporomusa malonica]SMC92052.1 PAS domain S-box-containing protein [Sporomusa malonica]
MNYKFTDLIDIAKLQSLMEAFFKISNIPTGILDDEGNVLVAVGWRDICRQFHRQCPASERVCRESDNCIKDFIGQAGSYTSYTCTNGLIEAAAPVIIAGHHLATIMQGQFFWENPDIDYFRKQAQRYGFDEKKYLDALDQVPIYSKDKLDSIMKFNIELAAILTELGLKRLQEIELQAKQREESDLQLFWIFDSIPNIAIQSWDASGKVLYWNKFSEQLYGYTTEEAIGKHISQLFIDESSDCVLKKIWDRVHSTKKLYGPEEIELKGRDGVQRVVYSTIFPIKLSRGSEFVCMDVDVTEQRKIQKEMMRLDRLHLVGEMAASIGHEVRNPLTTVRGYLQILHRKPEFDEYAERFEVMIEEIDRANQIITEFLSLARNKLVDKQMQCLNRVISPLMPLINADAVKNNVVINFSLGNIPEILLDTKEIRQLLLNFVRNGIEAMPKGGVLNVATSQERSEVILKVTDNGEGIPKQVLEKLGTPFVSTKDQGTGLGLAVSYSIAQRHQAKIEITSGDCGTTATIRFPIPVHH